MKSSLEIAPKIWKKYTHENRKISHKSDEF